MLSCFLPYFHYFRRLIRFTFSLSFSPPSSRPLSPHPSHACVACVASVDACSFWEACSLDARTLALARFILLLKACRAPV
eukprot:m.64621 g.64621  ORF g.64621 m.64621 type:complete len:80 (-) comp19561_c0_seq4:614-853(-)